MGITSCDQVLLRIAASLERERSGSLGRRPLASLRYAIQRTVSTHSEPALACWGPQHVLLVVNSAAQRMLPPMHGGPGVRFETVWPDLHAPMLPLFDAAMAQRPSILGQSADWKAERKGGQVEYYISAVHPIPGPDGVPVGALWSFTSVTAALSNARFLDTVLADTALRLAFVALPGCTVEWASAGALPPGLDRPGEPAEVHFDPAVCAALPMAAHGGSVQTVHGHDTTHVLFPVTRVGSGAGVLVVTSPAAVPVPVAIPVPIPVLVAVQSHSVG